MGLQNACQDFFGALQACFDVREAPALWAWQDAKLKYHTKEVSVPEFLSTHPANETRTQRLLELLPQVTQPAISIGYNSNLPDVSGAMDDLLHSLLNSHLHRLVYFAHEYSCDWLFFGFMIIKIIRI